MLLSLLLGLLSLVGATAAQNQTVLWQPPVGATWQIVLSQNGSVLLDSSGNLAADTPDVDVYDVDVFDMDAASIAKLHELGKRVICYFSAGTEEDWRPDAATFSSSDVGNGLSEWKGERWLQITSQGVRDTMTNRIKLAAEKGCDAIDPDNVDGFLKNTGFNITKDDAANYVKFLATEAAGYNMATGLKNAGPIVGDVIDSVQFCVNEQCVEYDECPTYAPFIAADKPVFHIEYPDGVPNNVDSKLGPLCNTASNFSTVIKTDKLTTWVMYCDGRMFGSVTPTPTDANNGANNGAAAISRLLLSPLLVSILVGLGCLL